MAELPRYRPLGAAIPSLPTINFSSAGQAQSRVYENINRGLDVMQTYVRNKEVAQTKLEAEQWAYDRELTADQLETALSNGRSIDEIVGDPTTVFGSVAIATTAAKLRTELEASARTQLAALSAKIEGGADIDLGKEITSVNSLSAGHTELLSQLDPAQANAFSAAVATMAAPVYSKGLERELKLRQAVSKAKGLDAMGMSQGIFEDIYSTDSGATVVDKNGFVTGQTDGQVDVVQSTIANQLIATNDADFAKTEIAKFADIREQAKINVLSGYAVDLPATKRLAALRRGDFGGKTFLYNTLDKDAQAELRKKIRLEISDRQSADDRIKNDLMIEARQDATSNVLTFVRSPSGSGASNNALAELERVAGLYPEVIDGQGILALEASVRAIEKDGYEEEEKPLEVFQLREQIFSGQITTYRELKNKADRLGVGPKQLLGIVDKLESRNVAAVKDVQAQARVHTNIVTGMINITAKKAQQFNSFVANVEARYDEAVEEWVAQGEAGARPNISKIAKDYRLELASSEFQEKIDNNMNVLKATYPDVPLDEDMTDQNIDDNQVVWGLDDDQVRLIKQTYTTIRKNQILRDEIR